ncbi:hypothetical protein CYY_006922 [Polysphondylium violaceum]|uniref:Centromere protein L n=1 Tax=Polysphondylium violaceum TaxID=133409 RepID=A0A8J4PYN2_9MYCE|nr:hypothetical protein CYY_006922 [Polysphondylium violaceum]
MENNSIEDDQEYVKSYKKFQALCSSYCLQDIRGSSWHIQKISPLLNFNNSNSKDTSDNSSIKYLFNLSKDLNSYIYGQIQENVVLRIEIIPVKDSDTLDHEDDDENDPVNQHSIGIFIYSYNLKKSASSVTKIILVKLKEDSNKIKWFHDGTNNKDIQNSDNIENDDRFHSFNMLLFQGSPFIQQIVSQWLQIKFKAYCSLIYFDSFSIYKLTVNWVQRQLEINHSEIDSQLLHMIFSTTNLLPSNNQSTSNDNNNTPNLSNLETITLDIPGSSLKTIISKINHYLKYNNHSKGVSKYDLFFTAIMQHFASFFNFTLDNCPLVQSGTSIALIGVSGKFKIYSQNVTLVLTDLVEYIQ